MWTKQGHWAFQSCAAQTDRRHLAGRVLSWRGPLSLMAGAVLRHRPPTRALRAALMASRCSASPATPVVALADARDDLAERLQRDHCVRVSRARLRHRARASVALPARRGAAATSASQALRAALADLPSLGSTVSPVAMLADARGDRACLRLRADAHPPRQRRRQQPTCRNAIQHEPSHPQRHRIRDLIDDNSGDATAQVNVGSLRLNAAHCRHRDPRVALARVRFLGPDAVLRQCPHRRRCAPRLRTCRARPLRCHRSPCSLTLAATVPNVFNEVIV